MTFWMKATPGRDNHAHPTGHFQITDLSLGVPPPYTAPTTEAEARALVEQWGKWNDRWEYEYLGTERKFQKTFGWYLV